MNAERDSVGRMLRQGDPYDGSPMPAAEVARVRARLQEATADPMPPRLWIPATAAATAALAAVALWLYSPGVGERAPVGAAPAPMPAPGAEPAADTPDSPRRTPLVHAAPSLPTTAALATQTPATEAVTTPAASAAARTQTVANDADRAVRSRSVQLTAPRGTRILWTLDPDYEPASGADVDRLEQAQQGAESR